MIPELFVHVPFRRLEATLPFLVQRKLQPEIAFLGEDLDSFDPGQLQAFGEQLAHAGLKATVHGPFHDLNSGALDPAVRELTGLRYRQVIEAARLLDAHLIILHPGYEHWRYGGVTNLWLQPNLTFWPPLLELADANRQIIALENIFERVPDTLGELLDRLDHPCLAHCFDVGHWHLFAETSLSDWLARLGHRLVHLHLHDNHGDSDAHLPLGEGTIDLPSLFRLAGSRSPIPSMTLEAHTRVNLEKSLRVLPEFLGFLH